MAKLALLRHGHVVGHTMVDDDIVDQLRLWLWYSLPKSGYVYRHDGPWNRRRSMYLHRQIMRPGQRMQVDHINGNPLDNRRCNLRVCDQTQNHCNRGPQSNNVSGYKGVFWNTQKGKWHARIQTYGTPKNLGFFSRVEDAAAAYKAAAVLLHGEFARSV